MASIVNVSGRQWLAGMTWASFEDTPSKDELKQDADRLKSDWTSVRIGESCIQAGFCEPLEGQKRPVKLYSLAAILADSREQPWLGIFQIEENLWWYIAVRDGHAILPDGDVIGGESEIRSAREGHSGYVDWNYIEGDLELLGEFIDAIDAKPTPVRSLTVGNYNLLPFLLITSILISSAGGGYWWWHQKQVKEEQERVAAMERMRAQLAGNQQLVTVQSPLLTTPSPNSLMQACNSIISSLPISISGWQLSVITCDQKAVQLHWIRGDGATVANKPEGTITLEGEAVDQTIPIVGLELKGDDNSITLEGEKEELRAWAQAASITLVITQPTLPALLPGAKPPVGPDNQPLPPPPPQSGVSLDLPISPFSIDFEVIPGFRITNIKTTQSGWHVEGTLYGK